ncbi:tRNA lysidine(34) synthetase TilS [Paenibacillus sp. JMULE4]|uniref:tRNA lysidine(34) synthetase TilS n=1 Tax=Paenibacillus TaxID=44249 RepID=UPI0010B0715C|nr:MULTISPECIES: tRNA lysidine(34) synthetase TilS [Paenibacillus]NTZ19698.1 tRNA lysidine(34) synthetase TilS [Paenibacillus sp. JMULE4]GCL74543.1 tRNA lysidine(34) synthetase TilS [Paenibacillus naphthalenovorans]
METAQSLSAKIERYIRDETLIEPGDGVVVAVSGGPDSVALLHLLFALSDRYGWRLVVAHVNHGFRGLESDREAELVSELAQRLGLPLASTYIDMPRYIEETGLNTQAAAREKRYAFLLDTAVRYQARRIALAHHADDQAETVMMRMLRGTGPSGLAGIPIRRKEKNDVELIRPLLRIYKSELLHYCSAQGLPYCTDSSNLQTKYFRNQIRLDVLPFLSRYNDQLPSALNRLAEMMAGEDDYLEAETLRLYKAHVSRKNDAWFWSAEWFSGVHVALQRRLIKLILSYLASDPESIDFLKIEQMRIAALSKQPTNFRRVIGQNITLSREYDQIAVHTMVLSPLPYVYEIKKNQPELLIPETGVRAEFRWLIGTTEKPQTRDMYSACFDVDELAFPVIFRSRRPGDRMRPLGLNGSKKVKDMFIDGKLPLSLREKIPIVTDAKGRILWLPGVRRSGHALAGKETKHVVCMKLDIDFT